MASHHANVNSFGQMPFWRGTASERIVLRRLRALAALDTDFEQGVRARDERRRQGLQVIVQRVGEQHGAATFHLFDDTVDILHTLTSFETFDTYAGMTRSTAHVITVIQRLAISALGLDESRGA